MELLASSADVLAIGNSWSAPDSDAVIWDELDDPALGRVFVGSTSIPALPPAAIALLALGIGAGAFCRAGRHLGSGS